MLRKIPLPVQLACIIAAVIIVGPHVPLSVVRASFTFSYLFKELLGFFLPFMVFSFVFVGISSFKEKAPHVLSVLIGCITLSNALVTVLAYLVVSLVLPYLINGQTAASLAATGPELEPFFAWSIPSIGSEKALLAALLLGLLASFFAMPRLEAALYQFKAIVETILLKIFIPFLPFYVLGFLLKTQHEGNFASLFYNYGKAFALIIVFQIMYLTLMFFIAEGAEAKKTWKAIINALPSYITAFGTMSSTATLPVSIVCAEKNTGNKALSHVAMPIMANVHLLGDCISTPVLALMTRWLFLGCLPTLPEYLVFAGYFTITMLAASGIPGGGIIVMIPILKSLLGFTPEMIGIIMTLYLLQDPLGTAGNVMGDGALVIMVNKLLKKLRIVS